MPVPPPKTFSNAAGALDRSSKDIFVKLSKLLGDMALAKRFMVGFNLEHSFYGLVMNGYIKNNVLFLRAKRIKIQFVFTQRLALLFSNITF